MENVVNKSRRPAFKFYKTDLKIGIMKRELVGESLAYRNLKQSVDGLWMIYRRYIDPRQVCFIVVQRAENLDFYS